MSARKKVEESARMIAHCAGAMTPKGSAYCVLMWGPDEKGQQWRTYVHNVAPVVGPDKTPDCRRVLAKELRTMADLIEARADVPPGVVGMG